MKFSGHLDGEGVNWVWQLYDIWHFLQQVQNEFVEFS